MNRIALFALSLATAVITLALALYSRPVGAFQQVTHERQVVRAHFDDPAMVNLVMGWGEPWEVQYDKGYLVIEAGPAELELLAQAGFRVEVDHKLTAELYRPRLPLPGQGGGIPGFPCYRTVEETFDSAQALADNFPTLATWTDQGDSWVKTQNPGLGYDMMVLALTNSALAGPKPKLFMTSAIHAREYTTAELAMRFAEYLVFNYGVDADATWLLDHHEVHLMLHTNPDGRKMAETGLSWRKNTNNNYCSNTNSRGADLNRNFQFQWGCCGGSSGNECSLTYRGASAGSEPEVQAVQNYIFSQFPDQRGPGINDPAPDTATGVYIDIHSYSELVLWPWGFTSTPAPNGVALQTLGRKLAYFNDYTPQQAIELYITDGTTDDFVYGEMGIAAYTFELGTAFFQGCSAFENTILPDNLPSLVMAAKVARTPYLTAGGPDAIDPALSQTGVAPGTMVTLTAQIDDTRYNNSNGTEPVQNVAGAEYYLDVPPWITTTTPISTPMVAVDGSFNSPVEQARGVIDTTGLATGRHLVYVRGLDAAGNWGPISAVFLYVLDPAVAPVVEGYVRAAGTNMPLAATVSAGGIFQTASDPASGFYQMLVISGTYDLTAAAPDHLSQTVEDVVAHDYETVQQDFSLPAVCAGFSDDAEGGNLGWTAQFPWAITTENAHSPTHSWTDSPGGNYSNNRNVSITSAVIDLTGYSGVSVNFWQICDTESGYDYCRVEISDNGGATWSEIAAFDGLHSQWEEISLAATMLDDEPDARLRFRFTTDGSVTADGWHLDDIRLLGAGAACGGSAPTAGFTSSSPDALGEPTSFTNTSSGSDLAYSWDFGDGSLVVTETNPVHTYTAIGTFTVTLTATNDLGSDSFSAPVEILLAPTAGFTSSSPDELGQTTVFTNTSTGDELSFLWEFGDGATSANANPSHVYGAAGNYTVTLTATNAVGSDTVTAEVEITLPPTFTYWLYLPAITHSLPEE